MERPRIDNWLKLVCLFKHRAEATEACRGGRVKVNGLRVKPAAPVHQGDVVEFLHNERFRRVIVTATPESQASKEAGRTMYIDESPEPAKQELSIGVFRERGSGRPTKRDRRETDRLKRS